MTAWFKHAHEWTEMFPDLPIGVLRMLEERDRAIEDYLSNSEEATALGTPGLPGPQGEQGEQGPQGDPGADGVVQSIVAGTNVTVDSTDPANPIVSASGGGGGSGRTQVRLSPDFSITAGASVTEEITDLSFTLPAGETAYFEVMIFWHAASSTNNVLATMGDASGTTDLRWSFHQFTVTSTSSGGVSGTMVLGGGGGQVSGGSATNSAIPRMIRMVGKVTNTGVVDRTPAVYVSRSNGASAVTVHDESILEWWQ